MQTGITSFVIVIIVIIIIIATYIPWIQVLKF